MVAIYDQNEDDVMMLDG